MKGAFVSRATSLVLVVAALAMGGCDDDPLDFDERDTDRLSVNPSFMVIPAGRTTPLEVRALNAGGEPNFEPVSFSAESCGGTATVTVAENPERTGAEPPGRLLVTAGNTLGGACVIVSAGGVTDTAQVVVVADAILITSAPDTVRAGVGGTVVAQIVALDSSAVSPFTATDATFSSDDSNIVSIAADGSFTTLQSGTAVITVTWSGTDATGTSGLGVTRTATVPITVVANVPASAAFAAPGDFGALAAGEQATLEVIVSDALGNQNTNPAEILGVSVLSSDVAVATAAATVDTTFDPISGEITGVNVNVTVTTVGPGVADITGTVSTTEGALAFGATPAVTVLAPSISSLAPSTGPAATVITISGAGLSAPGFETVVTVDGFVLGNFTVVSDTEITAQMPTFASSPHEVVVLVGGVPSSPSTWNQDPFDESATEENDIFLGAPPFPVGIPFIAPGTWIGDASVDDFFIFTLSRDATIVLHLDWDNGPDKDLLVVDAAFTAFQCNFVTASTAVPEDGECDLAAGDYMLWVDNFDTEDSNYNISVTIK